MSASRDIAITVIITPMCCQQMTLAAPGVGERAPAVVGWGTGVRGRGRCSAVGSVTATFICSN